LVGRFPSSLLFPPLPLPPPPPARQRWLWAAAMPALWALGWTVTTVAGISVGDQFTVFGSTGAITVSALLGLLLQHLLPARTPLPTGVVA
jgi:uncharacterized membrane protein